jgi:tetratricopeptide (TPR) repeat protein
MNTRNPTTRLSCFAMLAILSIASPGVAQTDAKAKVSKETFDGEQQWKTFFNEAKAAFGERRWPEAKSLYLKASAIKVTPKILGNLAQVEIQLGEYRAAATHAAEALETPGKSPSSADDLALASNYVGKVVIGLNVESATVKIDGEDVGVATAGKAFFVDPGMHKVEVLKNGYATAEKELVAQKGTEQRVDFELIADNGTKAAPTTASVAEPTKLPEKKPAIPLPFEEPKREPIGPDPLVLIAGGAVAVGGLVVGLAYHSLAKSASNKADALNREVGQDGCKTSNGKYASDCAALMNERKTSDRDHNVSTAAFIVGSAAAIGTIVYWIVPRSKSVASATGVHLMGGVGPDGGRLGIAGSF